MWNVSKKNKLITIIILFIWITLFILNNQNTKVEKEITNTSDNIVFALPFSPMSYPIIKMAEDWVFEKVNKKPELIFWKTPDQVKAMIAWEQADLFAVPSNMAATFYNKWLDVKLLNISIWRAIWMVSRSDDKKTLSDFKWEEIAMPFKWNMIHLVFMELARKQWLNPEKDFKLQYVPSPMDAAQKLIMRTVDHALLVDPAVSTVINKSVTWPTSIIAAELFRSVDIQDEWWRLFNTGNEIPFAWMMAGSEILNNKEVIELFNLEYEKASKWCVEHPEETAKLAVKYIPQLDEKGVEIAMKNVKLEPISTINSKERLEQFFQVLLESKPALVWGKLPDDNFYYSDK